VLTLPAHLVATPVLERLTGEVRGTVLGAGAGAAWVDLDGFVVAITTREVPLLPNAIALAAGSGALAGAGTGSGGTARLGPGRVTLGSLQITWDPAAPPSWDPTVRVPARVAPSVLAARGAAVLDALGSQHPEVADAADLVRELAGIGLATAGDLEGAAGLTWLFRAVGARDPGLAAAAVRALLGRGPGLTPEGDDLLAAVAGALAVLGPVAGPSDPPWKPLLDALRRLPGRTTALSATLLSLALDRRLPEPAARLLDLSPTGEKAWPAALTRLERLGHGSGRAYAAGIAATASLLAAGARPAIAKGPA
jgi:hypothetical protein